MQRLFPPLKNSGIEALRVRAYIELFQVSDFIWKVPRFIEGERAIEAEKLNAYFPQDGIERNSREGMEKRKLNSTFPYMIATGNLFALGSVFESYLLLLAEEVQNLSGQQLGKVKGQGLSKLFTFFKYCGLSLETAPLHEQIVAALKIRNCLMHASGMLYWSKEAAELQRIVNTMSFLSSDHRQRRKQLKDAEPLVNIVQSGLGKRVVVQNMYNHVLCGYLSQYFVSLCESADKAIRVGDY